jgi:hypothetical protein
VEKRYLFEEFFCRGSKENGMIVERVYILVFETGSCCETQAGLEFSNLLPQSQECWEKRCVPPHPAGHLFFNIGNIRRLYDGGNDPLRNDILLERRSGIQGEGSSIGFTIEALTYPL